MLALGAPILKAIFLDRDNTLIHDPGYVHLVSQVHLLPGVLEACKIFSGLGYKLFIVSNQSGVGRGFFPIEDVLAVETHLRHIFKQSKVEIVECRYCFHLPDEKCQCRKPSPLLINELLDKYHLDRQQCYMVGDKSSDAESGKNAQIKGILLADTQHKIYPTFHDLLAFARSLQSGQI